MAAVKLAGFLALLVAIFVCARAAGSTAGPVTTSHSQVQYTGRGAPAGGTNMGGMNMGAQP